MEAEKRDHNRRRVALGAFAKSVKRAGKFEWVMTIILFLFFGGFIAFFAIKYLNFPDWTLYLAFIFVALLGVYVGYEIYLSRVIRGNELKSFLELSSLVGHTIEKLERIELYLMKEMDMVIGIKKDVTKDQEEKEKISKVTPESVKQDVNNESSDKMIFKWCPTDKEEVYVSKAMRLCPFCWNELEEMEQQEVESAEAITIQEKDEKKSDEDELLID